MIVKLTLKYETAFSMVVRVIKNRIIDNLKYRELIDKVEFSKTKHTIRHNCFINLLKKIVELDK